MQVGDLVTWKQRDDLRELPCPWRRLGIIVGLVPPAWDEFDVERRCNVHWYESGNTVNWAIDELELAR